MLFWVCSLNSTEGLGIGLSVVIIYINNKFAVVLLKGGVWNSA